MSTDRRTPEFEIVVNDRAIPAREGESVAAALWNAGIRQLRTSVTGESRSWLCSMGSCFECVVSIDGQPRRACVTACAPNMSIVVPVPEPPDEGREL